METVGRHQCLIYEGSPSRHLPALAAVIKRKLNENFRCIYLNSPVMVAGVRCYLAACGTDVVSEIGKGSLILSSERQHLMNGRFDVERMIQGLDEALEHSLRDSYDGLWATGDMTWEMGPQGDFSQLLEYEWRLEEFFRTHPALCGICQYHVDTLPHEVLLQGLVTHPSIFQSATLAQINPHYLLGTRTAIRPQRILS